MKEQPPIPKERTQAIVGGVRGALLELGSATKAELSERLGISFPTVSKVLTRLERQGEVLTLGRDESSGGRRALRYAYLPEAMLSLSLFLEKAGTRYAVCTGKGETLETGAAASFLPDDRNGLADQIASLVAAHPRIRAIAVGVPGAVRAGRIIHIPGYAGYRDFHLQEFLEARFSLPAAVENDMNAAALGYQARRGETGDSLLYLYFGQNGPGAGLLVGGEVVRGHSFFSGEISFLPLYDKRNFQEALAGDRTDAVARLIAASAALFNPRTVVFCRGEATEAELAGFAETAARYVPAAHLPELLLSGWEEDYLHGLHHLALARMLAAAD